MVDGLTCTRHILMIDNFDRPADLVDYYKAHFGPTITTYAGLAADPDRVAALDKAFLDYAIRHNEGPPEGPARFAYEYLLVVGERRGA